MAKLLADLPAVVVITTSALAASAGPVAPAGAEWSEIGSGLPRTTPAVKSLAIDPATPSALYAIDWDGRLFKSTDSGAGWKVRGSVDGVRLVVVDPTDSSILYAVTQHGVFKSVDGGESWTAADSGLEGIAYYSITLTIDTLTPATLYAATERGIFKSTDAARSWNKLDAAPTAPGIDLFPDAPYYIADEITIDPVTPLTLYFSFYTGNNDRGILKSTDGGQSWTRLDNGPGVNPFGLVVDPVTSSTLYTLSSKNDGNICKSTDGGQTWTIHPAAPPGTSVSSLAIDPVSPSTLYAASSNGLGWAILKSMDSGENWSVVNTGPPTFANSGGNTLLLAVSPTTPATVYSGNFNRELPSGHLAKSTDGGVTWNAVDAGLTYVDVRALAVDPMIPSRIYAGMSGAPSAIPLFRSTNGGASWTSFAQFELSYPSGYCWINSLLLDPSNANVIYAAANGTANYSAVFKTTDGGAKWTGTYFFAGNQRVVSTTMMALDTADSKTIYLADYGGIVGDARLFKSADGGSNWTDSYYWEIGPINALVIDPGNRHTLYAGTPEGVFQSTDGGASWTNIGLSTGVSSLALDPGNPNTIYAAGGTRDFGAGFRGLFKSTDGGASWVAINNGLASVLDSRSTVNAIAFAPENRSTLYVATSGGGVYKSLDGGANWEPLNQGLTNLDVRLLAVASNVLYAVTSSGIFKATD
jgi:photosystem II stability/assembly factor-like uncharacterized protein